MNPPSSQFLDRVEKAFQPTERGVIGLVDNLLELGRGQKLRFDFQDDHCSIRLVDADSPDVDVSLPKSVFRAVLARIAVLCKEHVSADPMTPYRGEGEVSLATDSLARFRVTFTNTSAEQRLEIADLQTCGDEAVKVQSVVA